MEQATKADNQFRTVVVTDDTQMKHALCVRAICFVEENGVPASHVTDGNDFTATHFLLYMGDEPIGSLRVRWFRDFAKFERLCVRKQYRNVRVLKRFVDFVFDHAARKGYQQMITHAEEKYVKLWGRFFGLSVSTHKKPMPVAGHSESYIEMHRKLAAHPNVISPDTDTETIDRIEGAWDQPSKLETRV